eukprot:TRINITY_DN6764_c0_g1_i3.p2 TRINITY_DN6764_c0_g1~~TRINITY_DN6764_c0_g1_i3.p2  ORF type:complete len:233 (-),score=49.33 TRINITY_DN6764_c0_g1_i3:1627-2325(-)
MELQTLKEIFPHLTEERLLRSLRKNQNLEKAVIELMDEPTAKPPSETPKLRGWNEFTIYSGEKKNFKHLKPQTKPIQIRSRTSFPDLAPEVAPVPPPAPVALPGPDTGVLFLASMFPDEDKGELIETAFKYRDNISNAVEYLLNKRAKPLSNRVQGGHARLGDAARSPKSDKSVNEGEVVESKPSVMYTAQDLGHQDSDDLFQKGNPDPFLYLNTHRKESSHHCIKEEGQVF